MNESQTPTSGKAKVALLEQKSELAPVRDRGGEAVDEAVRRHLPMVYSTCLRITRNRHDAEDATQAVFLCLAIQARQRNTIRNIGPWLYRVACRTSLDLLRRRKRKRAHELAGGIQAQQQQTSGDAYTDANELCPIVLGALDQLPSRYRIPLILHYFGGQSHQQLADELGCNRSTLRVRMHRGHKMLREALEQQGISLAGGTLGVILAAAVRSHVSESLVTSTVYMGQHATAFGPQACVVPHDVLHAACHAAGGSARVKLLMGLAAAAIIGACAAGTPLLARLINEIPRVPEIRDLSPVPKLQLTAPLPGLSDAGLAPAHPAATPKPEEPMPLAARPAAPSGVPPHFSTSRTVQRVVPSSDYQNPWLAGTHGRETAIDVQGQAPNNSVPRFDGLYQIPSPYVVLGRALQTQPETHGIFVPRDDATFALQDSHPAPSTGSPPPLTHAPGAAIPHSSPAPATTPTITNVTAIACAIGSPWVGAPQPSTTTWTRAETDRYVTACTELTAAGQAVFDTAVVNGKLNFSYYSVQAADCATSPIVTPPARIIHVLDNSGQVVSQGTYDIADYSSYDQIINTHDNTAYNGWFAMTGGKIVLPAIHLTTGSQTYNWGESEDDSAIDLINSVSLHPHNVTRAGDLKLTLLACEGPLVSHTTVTGNQVTQTWTNDPGDFPAFPAGHHLLGMWKMDNAATIDGGIDLTIRYDNARIASLGGDEGLVKLWYYEDGWHRVTDSSFFRDTSDHLVGGDIPADSTYFAVSLPEPAAGFFGLTVGSSLLLRRRRSNPARG